MALPPVRRSLLPYGGAEESTPRPETVAERLMRVEMVQQRHREDIDALKEVATELKELAEAVRPLTERKKFSDKLILAAAVLLVTGLLGMLMRISWLVQSAKLP
jgi:hypothetical protein